jgi:EAL domain-containing protein (putative c-di-GMP-specific phosphodiesterase class I)
MDILRDARCDKVQGFLLSRPVSLDRLLEQGSQRRLEEMAH